MKLKVVFILSLFSLFVGCSNKSYTYRSTISEGNISIYLSSKIEETKPLYQVETNIRATYFISIESAKIMLAKELLQNIKKLCKKEKKRYFAIVSPKELSNIPNGSLVNSSKEFIQKLQRESFYRNVYENYASITVNVLLLQDRPINYIVWDSKDY